MYGIILVIFLAIMVFFILFVPPIDVPVSEEKMQAVEEEYTPAREYSEEELEEALDLHHYILSNGTVPASSVASAGTYIGALIVGGVIGWLYLPAALIIWLLNIAVPGAPQYNLAEEASEGMLGFILLLDFAVVFFAVYGVGKLFDSKMGVDNNKDKLFKDYAERMQAVIVKQKEEYDKLYESDVQVLNIKLENREEEVKQWKEKLKTETENYKKALTDLKDEYRRKNQERQNLKDDDAKGSCRGYNNP